MRSKKTETLQDDMGEDKKLELMQEWASTEKGSSFVIKFISICFPLSNGCFE